jgi:uncharacterized membrane protein
MQWQWQRRLSQAQRVVLVIGFGLFLAALRSWLVGRPLENNGGWFNYVPNTGPAYDASRPWSNDAVFALTTALIVTWAALSTWFMHQRQDTPEGSDDPPT